MEKQGLDSQNLQTLKQVVASLENLQNPNKGKQYPKHLLRGLYAISDEVLTPYEFLPNFLESAFAGGVKIFQLRDKTRSDEELMEVIKCASSICAFNNVLFVLNDRIELALKTGVSALHIGEDSDVAYVRKHFTGILGVSCYGYVDRAVQMQNLGADYVTFGAIFASKTKSEKQPIGYEILAQAREVLQLPICAIGGINTENVHLLKNADMLAVINCLWESSGDLTSKCKSIEHKARILSRGFY